MEMRFTLKNNNIYQLSIFLCISFFILCTLPRTVFAQDNSNITAIYSLKDKDTKNQIKTLDVILGEFTSDVQFIQDTDLTESSLKNSNKLIYFGIDKVSLSDKVKKIVNDFQGGTYAIGHNVEQLSRFSWVNFKGESLVDTVLFNDENVTLPEQRIIYNSEPKDAEVICTAHLEEKPKETVPLIEKKDNDFYFSTEVLANSFDWFLADSMSEFLGIKLKQSMKYLRLEDVHPRVDPKTLQEQAEYLKEKNIPYMVAVIPIYTDGNGNTIHLSDSPELVKTLQYMQDNGASIVLHGYRHQYRSSETGEGFEFWDVENDRPILQPSDEKAKLRSDFKTDEQYQEFYNNGLDYEKKYTEDAIENGIEELVANGLYPLGFEAPHYTISQEGYKILSKHFSSYIGQLQLSDETWESQYQPMYASTPSFLNGMTVYPETLGFVEDGDKEAIETIKDEIKNYDPFKQIYLSAFYHPYLGVDQLKQVVPLLESTDTQWFDLKQESNKVTADDIKITSNNGEITVDKPFISSDYERGLKFKKFIPYIVIILIIIVILIMIIL